jgi:hypothetical protein
VTADRFASPALARTERAPQRGPLQPPIPWDDIGSAPSRTRHRADATTLGTDAEDAGPEFDRTNALLWSLAGYLLVFVGVALFAIDPSPRGYGASQSGVLVAIVLTPFVILLATVARHREHTFDLGGVIIASWGMHLIAAYFRFGEAVDALDYNSSGRDLATSFRGLDFFVDTGREVPGTGSVRYLTGLIHVVTGSTFFATFLIFTALSFLGVYWFYRAFEIGFPNGDRKRYALLLFFWPTLVYWPSSLGKDACLVAAIGLATFGVARLLQHRRGGLTITALGTLAAAMIRPHVAMIIVIALMAALLLRRSRGDGVGRLTAKVFAVGLLLVGGSVLSSATAEFLDLENLGISSVNEALDTTVIRTNQGGSAFTPVRATNPIMYPLSFVTVLYRPFPGEAGSDVDGLLASGAAAALLLLTLVSFRRITGAIRNLRSEPFVMYAFSYMLVFVYVFSVIGNFGILDRQRTQLLPLLFVMLAAPRAMGYVRGGARRRIAARVKPLAGGIDAPDAAPDDAEADADTSIEPRTPIAPRRGVVLGTPR